MPARPSARQRHGNRQTTAVVVVVVVEWMGTAAAALVGHITRRASVKSSSPFAVPPTDRPTVRKSEDSGSFAKLRDFATPLTQTATETLRACVVGAWGGGGAAAAAAAAGVCSFHAREKRPLPPSLPPAPSSLCTATGPTAGGAHGRTRASAVVRDRRRRRRGELYI